MPDEISSFPGYETYSQYRPYGNNYGNPILNALAFGAFGSNYAPRPGEGQSYYDASIERSRTRQFMGLQGSEFASNMAFKAAGINPNNSTLQMIGRNFASPDSGLARLLSPMVGGNPMAAAQGLYAGMQGANIMGAFGRPEGVTAKETSQMMRVLEKSFYKKEGIGDVANKMDAEYSNRLLNDPVLAEQSGIGTLSEDESNDAKSTGADRRKGVMALNKEADSLAENETRRGTKDFNKELSKQLSEHIEKVLIKSNKLTSEELKKARDSNGIVKPEVIRNLTRTELQRAGIEEKGLNYDAIKNTKLSEIADKVNEGRRSKDIRLDIISQARREYNSATTNEEKIAANKKIREQLTGLGIKEPGQFLGFGAAKKIDEKFLNEQEAKQKAVNYTEYKAAQYKQYQEAGGRYSGINFANTRGFNIEDFTSGFKSSSELGMLGGKSKDMVGKFDNFMQNSGGTLSAARSVFGNKSGSELVGKISDLMGTSGIDMSSKEGSSEVEQYLRSMKATARIAGVSMHAMLDTIDAAKELAKNNPRLSTLSAGAAADMTTKAFQTASAMSGVMTGTDIRKAGGQQGMVAASITEQQKLLSSDMGQGIVALQQMFAGDKKKSAAMKKALEQFPHGVRQDQLPELMESIMSQKGMEDVSRADLMNGMNNKFYQDEGNKNKDFAGKATDMMKDTIKSQLYTHLFDASDVDVNREGFAAAYEQAKEKNPELQEQDFKSTYVQQQIAEGYKKARAEDPNLSMDSYMGTFLRKDAYAASLFGQAPSTFKEGIARTIDPKYFEKVDKMREQDIATDKEMDEKYASRYAQPITQLMSTLASGKGFGEGEAEKLMGIFGDAPGSEKLKEGFQRAVVSAGQGDGDEALAGTAAGISEATGETITGEDIKNMATAGFREKDNKEALKRLDTLAGKKNRSATEEMEFKALQAAKKQKILDSGEAYKAAKEGVGQGHDGAAVTAASIMAQRDDAAVKEFDEDTGAKKIQSLDQLLTDTAKDAAKGTSPEDAEIDTDINTLKDFYGNDTKKMMDDARKKVGLFDKDSKVSKEYGVDLTSDRFASVRNSIEQKAEDYESSRAKLTGAGDGDAAAKSNPQEDMNKNLSALTAELQGGTLAKAVELLAGKV